MAMCTTLCHKICQLLATDRWFSVGSPVSSTNKTDRHDITECLLTVVIGGQLKSTTVQRYQSFPYPLWQ